MKGFLLISSMFVQNSFQAHANRNGPFLAILGTKDLDYFGQDRVGKNEVLVTLLTRYY